jgi:hypothetical protein
MSQQIVGADIANHALAIPKRCHPIPPAAYHLGLSVVQLGIISKMHGKRVEKHFPRQAGGADTRSYASLIAKIAMFVDAKRADLKARVIINKPQAQAIKT